MFEIKEKDGLARIGVIETKHGYISTPNLAPVIHPISQDLPAKEIRDKFGAEIIMTNSYTIWRSDLKDKVVERGLHDHLNFDGPIMTDSGTFQSYIYGKTEVTNHEIVTFQRNIGSDLGTVLDVFSEPEHKRQRVENDIAETLRRTQEAVTIRNEMPLIGAVQGGLFLDLREKCARELSQLNVAINAIGGVVPLMEAYRYRDLVNVIVSSKRGLRHDRPVHLFGAGHPMVFGLAVLLGCDLFDSSSYDKYARAGRMMFVDGTRHLEDLETLPCDCPACTSHDINDFQRETQLLARHNLYESFRELKTIRNAIKSGGLWELVERRCRSHPKLLDALKELRNYTAHLERFEPLSRLSAFLYVGPESIHRPSLYRLRKNINERYSPPSKNLLVIFPEGGKPYLQKMKKDVAAKLKKCDSNIIVKSALGPVPIELDEFYPFSQSIIPEKLDIETQEAMEAFTQQYIRSHGFEQIVLWRGNETLNELPSKSESSQYDFDMMRVRAVADIQFGRGAADALLGGKIEFVKSSNTDKIRNVLRDGVHVLSMRAHDGMFTLKLEGAKILHNAFSPPALRVVVETDTAEFNRQGKNVFAKFVLDCDPELRPGDECLVIDARDRLVAVGRLFMSREEMLVFERGLAVHVREGCPQPS